MASVERGELYAADVMTVFDRHEMCMSDPGYVLVRCLVHILSLPAPSVAVSDGQSYFPWMLELLPGVLLTMLLAMDAGPLLGVVSYCQPTSWLRVAGVGHGELLPTDFVDRWGVQLSGDVAAENWFSVRCHVLV